MPSKKVEAAFAQLARATAHIQKTPTVVFEIPETILKLVNSHDFGRIERPIATPDWLQSEWRNYLATNSLSISSNHLKLLAWHPQVSLSKEFVNLLHSGEVSITKKTIKGLIYSSLFVAQPQRPQILDSIKVIVDKSPSRPSIDYLNGVSPLLSDPSVLAEFCNDIISIGSSFQDEAANCFKFDASGTEFLNEIQKFLIVNGLPLLADKNSQRRKWYCETILLPSDSKSLLVFFEALLARRDIFESTYTREELKTLVTLHSQLGDPRLPQNVPKWNIYPKQIRDEIAALFSEEDIKLFFEILIDDRDDTQRRKAFWLQYSNKVLRTRVFLPSKWRTDKNHPLFKRGNMDSPIFGILQKSAGTAAFVIDFGKFIAVEFSEAGNACYIFTETDGMILHKDFWATSLSTPQLKSDKYSHWLKHKTDKQDTRNRKRWHQEFSDIFAAYGLLPSSNLEGKR